MAVLSVRFDWLAEGVLESFSQTHSEYQMSISTPSFPADLKDLSTEVPPNYNRHRTCISHYLSMERSRHLLPGYAVSHMERMKKAALPT